MLVTIRNAASREMVHAFLNSSVASSTVSFIGLAKTIKCGESIFFGDSLQDTNAKKNKMNGCVVEVHGLRDPNLDGLRGVVVKEKSKTTRKVRLDSGTVCTLEIKNLCAVFCVGLPRECRARVSNTETLNADVAFGKALDGVDCSKFCIVFMGVSSDSWWHFAKIPTGIVTNVMSAAAASSREPLVRFYISSYSQDDRSAKIRFGMSMQDPEAAPSHADLSSEYVMQLSEEMQSPVNATERNYHMELKRYNGRHEKSES